VFVLLGYSKSKLTVKRSFSQFQMLFALTQIFNCFGFLFFATLSLVEDALFFTLQLHHKSHLLLNPHFLNLIRNIASLTSVWSLRSFWWSSRIILFFFHHNLILSHNICALRTDQSLLLFFGELLFFMFWFLCGLRNICVFFSKNRFENSPIFTFYLVDDYSYFPGPCFSSSLSLFSGCFGF